MESKTVGTPGERRMSETDQVSMKRHTPRKYRRGSRKWREHWTVMLEWIGNKPQVLPLIEHHIRLASDGSGTMLACSLNDATWTCYRKTDAEHLFGRLKRLGRIRFSPYVRVQLFHDFKDVPIHFGPEGSIAISELGRGVKRLAVYRLGKTPDFSKLYRKPPRARKKKSVSSLKPKQKGAKSK
jgi:hypothetical protein